jgi:hypothetical protein
MVGENGKLKPFTNGQVCSRKDWIGWRTSGGRMSLDDANVSYEREGKFTEVWDNDVYHVLINKNYRDHNLRGCTMWHLAIERVDGDSIHDWRDLQAIKNMLVGPEHEAIELYPAESRATDRANVYHLYALIAKEGTKGPPHFPVGWTKEAHGKPLRLSKADRQRR